MNDCKEEKTQSSLWQRIWAQWAKWGKEERKGWCPLTSSSYVLLQKKHTCPFRKNKSRLRSSKVMCPNTDLRLNRLNWAAFSPTPMTAQRCSRTSWVTPTADTSPCWRVGCTYAGGHQYPTSMQRFSSPFHIPLLPLAPAMGKDSANFPFLSLT